MILTERKVHRDGTCGAKRQKLMKDTPKGMVGVYIPTCDNDGNYEKLQCHPSNGQCWCVEKMNGKRIDGTTVSPGESIDCETPGPPPKSMF